MDSSLARYAENLRQPKAAQSYSTKYQRYWHKRLSDARERVVIQSALALTGGPHQRILDMPCGAGRLTTELLDHGREICACDYSEEQLRICRERHADRGVTVQRASCYELPFEDGAFDLVFSVRLSHHIGEDADRERYLRELMRVSSGFVVATFFDSGSFKNRLRELRRRFLGSRKRAKYTVSMARLRRLAEQAGWTVEAMLPISRLFSGHRYVVFRSQGTPGASTKAAAGTERASDPPAS